MSGQPDAARPERAQPSPYVCKTCGHPRFLHSGGHGRCYAGGKGAAWCKCQSYDGPAPPGRLNPRSS